VRAFIGSLLSSSFVLVLISFGACATPRPTPEYLELRPQTISVGWGTGGSAEVRDVVANELARSLRDLGYGVPERGFPGDAEVRFEIVREDSGRDWNTSRPRAAVGVVLQVFGPDGTVFEGSGQATEEDDDDRERNHDLGDFLFDAAWNGAFDQVLAPDYGSMLRHAGKSAARGALHGLPRKMAPTAEL